MPAVSFDVSAATVAALIVHTMVGHDGHVGAAHDEDGLLIDNGFDQTTARERAEHKNHSGLVVMAISNNPSVRLQFDGKVYDHTGEVANPHPGKGLPLTGIANYVTAYRGGIIPHEDSWWELMEPSLNVPSGGVNQCRFTANLWNPAYLTGGNYVYEGNA